MKTILRAATPIAAITLALASAHCGQGVSNMGTSGTAAMPRPNVTGTIFTIVFENKDEASITPGNAYFTELARANGSATAYVVDQHPSLPNYIVMSSGTTGGIADDADPAAHQVAGTDNLGSQLEAAHIPWRAYGEGMGTACNLVSNGPYAAKHMPFVYYSDLTNNTAVCNDRVVDFEQNFEADLASNQYRYMWITPNMCNDMHDCPVSTGEAFLRTLLPKIMASPGYQNNGAIFIMWDEGGGPFGIPSGAANIASIVISPQLVSPGFQSTVHHDHTSYLATVEDILGMPRLPSTEAATPMSEFFNPSTDTTSTAATATTDTTGSTTSTSTSTSMSGM